MSHHENGHLFRMVWMEIKIADTKRNKIIEKMRSFFIYRLLADISIIINVFQKKNLSIVSRNDKKRSWINLVPKYSINPRKRIAISWPFPPWTARKPNQINSESNHKLPIKAGGKKVKNSDKPKATKLLFGYIDNHRATCFYFSQF